MQYQTDFDCSFLIVDDNPNTMYNSSFNPGCGSFGSQDGSSNEPSSNNNANEPFQFNSVSMSDQSSKSDNMCPNDNEYTEYFGMKFNSDSAQATKNDRQKRIEEHMAKFATLVNLPMRQDTLQMPSVCNNGAQPPSQNGQGNAFQTSTQGSSNCGPQSFNASNERDHKMSFRNAFSGNTNQPQQMQMQQNMQQGFFQFNSSSGLNASNSQVNANSPCPTRSNNAANNFAFSSISPNEANFEQQNSCASQNNNISMISNMQNMMSNNNMPNMTGIIRENSPCCSERSVQSTNSQQRDPASRGNQPQNSFLYDLFEVTSLDTNNDIIKWLPHGKGFMIHNKPKFEKNILPKILPKIQFPSFTRRLKRWHFQRVSSGIEMGAYYHPYFQRGKPHLLSLINTVDAPPLNLEHASTPTPKSKKPTPIHQKFISSLGLTNSGRVAPDNTHPSGKDKPTDFISDVREFPKLMREISKTKRTEFQAARRKVGAVANMNKIEREVIDVDIETADMTDTTDTTEQIPFQWEEIMNQPFVAMAPSPEPTAMTESGTSATWNTGPLQLDSTFCNGPAYDGNDNCGDIRTSGNNNNLQEDHNSIFTPDNW